MQDKICLISGATSGLGFALAAQLARRGATLVMLCRRMSLARARRVELIAASDNPNIDLMPCDLSDLEDVRRCSEDLKTYYPRIDLLCNLAGVRRPARVLSRQGFELNLATNVLGPFLLTRLLGEVLQRSGPATVLNVASDSHRTGRLHLDNLNLRQRYTMSAALGQANLLRILWTYELARRWRSSQVTANVFCPPWTRSAIYRHFPWPFRVVFRLAARLFASVPEAAIRPYPDLLEQGALHGLNGKYLVDGRPVPSASITYRRDLGRLVWDKLEAICQAYLPVGQARSLGPELPDG